MAYKTFRTSESTNNAHQRHYEINKNMVNKCVFTNKHWKFESGTIEYKRGILQGDALSVILFILQVMPASFLLENADGHKLGKLEPKENLNHLLFVDDLTLYQDIIRSKIA